MRKNEEPLPDYSDDWANQKPIPLIGRNHPSSVFDFSANETVTSQTNNDPKASQPTSRDPEIEEILKTSENDADPSVRLSSEESYEDATAEDRSTESDSSIDPESSDGVIYKKERPFVKFLMLTGIALLSALAILFIVGFIIGLSGSRPPNFDGQVIYDQWNNLSGNEKNMDDTIDELSKNEP